MRNCYINGIATLSAQPTTDPDHFLEEIIEHTTPIFKAYDPDYKSYIKPAAMRRMSKAVKMGVTTAKMALEMASLDMPDAIITGTGMGCKQDSEKFLEKILNDDEQFLTPTLFIQSTHNTVGGQIALTLGCKGYNVTYVQEAVSFEVAVMDAQLMLSETPEKQILVGGIDEIPKNSTLLHQLDGQLKTEEHINVVQLLDSTTQGTVASEGATCIVLSAEKTPNSIASIKAVEIISSASSSTIQEKINAFLIAEGMTPSDIDAVILGNNGDSNYDYYYHDIQQALFQHTEQLCYKHLTGDYLVASSVGFWLSSKILQKQQVPPVTKVNAVTASQYKNILLYNQYQGKNHSIVLMQHVHA